MTNSFRLSDWRRVHSQNCLTRQYTSSNNNIVYWPLYSHWSYRIQYKILSMKISIHLTTKHINHIDAETFSICILAVICFWFMSFIQSWFVHSILVFFSLMFFKHYSIEQNSILSEQIRQIAHMVFLVYDAVCTCRAVCYYCIHTVRKREGLFIILRPRVGSHTV